jgi:hypothetical protein
MPALRTAITATSKVKVPPPKAPSLLAIGSGGALRLKHNLTLEAPSDGAPAGDSGYHEAWCSDEAVNAYALVLKHQHREFRDSLAEPP